MATYRPYDPTQGRWLSRDPAGEAGDRGGNLYMYGGGDPTNQRDPSGLWSFTFTSYDIVGGAVTIGHDPAAGGGFFLSGRLGLGVGGGASFDPNGGAPGPYCPGKRTAGINGFAEGQVAAGPVEFGGSATSGINFSANKSGGYGMRPYPTDINPFSVTYGSSAGAEVSAAVGLQVTVFPLNWN